MRSDMKIIFAILLFAVSAVASANPTRALEAVGRIQGTPEVDNNDQIRGSWLGTGWVIRNPHNPRDPNYYVVTNNHVAEGFAFPTIRLCGSDETLALEPLISIKEMDVAILRVRNPRANMATVALGNSDRLRVGNTVHALGSPRGLDCTVTRGIASNVTRDNNFALVTPRGVIQTDADINPGNSGGPLMTRQGGRWVVVGMNTFIYTTPVTGTGGAQIGVAAGSSGLGFSVPVEVVEKVFADYLNRGDVYVGTLEMLPRELPTDAMTRQMYFGISAEEAARTGFGAWVVAVKPNSPIAASGLTANDVIATVGGESIRSITHLQRVLAYTTTDTVVVEVIRSGNRISLNVPVTYTKLNNTIPKAEGYANTTGMLLTAANNASTLAALRNGLELPAPLQNAVIVTAVTNLSPAHAAGISNGDVIVGARRQSVALQAPPVFTTAAELQEYIETSIEPVIVEVVPTNALAVYASGRVPALAVVQLKRIEPKFDGGSSTQLANR